VTLLELWVVFSMTTPTELDMPHCAYAKVNARIWVSNEQ
jgi:hypothetical protein